MHEDWKKINGFMKSCQDNFIAASDTERPTPVVINFVKWPLCHPGIEVHSKQKHIYSVDEFETLITYMKGPSTNGNVPYATGFMMSVPLDVAVHFFGIGVVVSALRTVDLPNFVGITHVEHLYDGYRTALIKTPEGIADGDWSVWPIPRGVSVPSIIHPGVYGSASKFSFGVQCGEA